MASVRKNFEKALKDKLAQKSTAHSSEETVMLKAFKYFDLDNSGKCNADEFIKAVEKIGVVGFSADQIEELLNLYDADGSGDLDYNEFAAILFANASASTRQKSPQKSRPTTSHAVSGGESKMDAALEKFRTKLAARGARGIIGLGKQFKIMDDDGSRNIDIYEFTKTVKDYRIDIPELDIQRVFDAFDSDGGGSIDYDELLRGIRGPMNAFRKSLVNQAFGKMDKDRSGVLDMEDIRDVYDAKNHPDVKAGKKTEDDILGEFLETFELHHSVNGPGRRDRSVTKDEFQEYYNNVSASVDNDQYFELMMTNAWKLGEASQHQKKKAWSNRGEEGSPKKSIQKAPQTDNRASPVKATNGGTKMTRTENMIVQKLRSKLAARGGRGIIGLQRQFKIIDDDNSKSLDMYEFKKGLKDFRVDVTEQEVQVLFGTFDRDGNGSIDYDEFLRGVRGPMAPSRTKLVERAFKKIDTDGSGILEINDIKGIFDASNHPDVVSGKKAEDDILYEFLETFEAHHNISTGSRDKRVTWEEFTEYYNNISASVDNDEYFELMMKNAWHLDGPPINKKAWAGGVGGPKSVIKGSVSKAAPYGTDNETPSYALADRPGSTYSRRGDTGGAAGSGTAVGGKPGASSGLDGDQLVEAFQKRIAARGGRGIIGLGRQFKIMDDDGSKSLDVYEFQKACKDFRVDLPADDTKKLFARFDRDGSGSIDYDEFIRAIRGPMNENRKKLVRKAFKKIDKDGSGVLDINDIKDVYNAKNHPDVKSGKKTEEEVLGEFLDTFEMHHSIANEGGRDRSVTQEEFLEYYNNISSSVDDDRYFDLMMNNAWQLDGKKPKTGGWAGEC